MRTTSLFISSSYPSFKTVLGSCCAFLLLIPSPLSATLRLTEIMYHPLPLSETDETESGEYLEFHNAGSESLSLRGYQIDRGITFQFPPQATIPAKGYIVVAKTREAVPDSLADNRVFVGFEGNLSYAGETIRLLNSSGETLINLRYGSTGDWPAAADGTGHSLSLGNTTENPNSARAWIPSLNRHGSPGGPEFSPTDDAQTTRELIRKGTLGRYFKGTKEPSGGNTAWTEPDFSTNGDWLTGRSGFGYSSESSELVPVTTRLNDMRGNYQSLYVRLPFDLALEELRRFEQLTLRMHYDDSYVIYLNGTRVAAAGVNGNPPAFNQNSNAGSDYAPDNINLSQHRELLNPGQNMLAIQGHNIGLNNSSDFVLGPELNLRLSPDPTPNEQLRKIVINEIQSNHVSQPDYVEFYNPTDTPLDLSGLWLSDKSDNLGVYQLPAQSSIAPGGFLSIPLSATSTGFAISSLGDQIFLSSEDLTEVIAAYAFGAQAPNTSIGRFPDGAPDWFPSSEPSPGTSNSRVSTPSVVITELMYHDAISQRREFIEIRHLGNDPIDVSGWEFNGVRFTFPNDTILEPNRSYLIADDAETLRSTYPQAAGSLLGDFGGSLSNRGERISILDLNDIVVDTVQYDDRFPWPITPDGIGASLERHCFEAEFDSPDAWSASPLLHPTPGTQNNIESCAPQGTSSIKISEILYHPTTENIDDRIPEFIELTNIGTSAISLSGWVLAGDVFFVFPENASIPPKQALVVAWDPTGLQSLHASDLGSILGPYQGELPNGGGEILLVKQDGRLADQARYNDDFPWPSLADGGNEGGDISLGRRCLEESGDLPSNWIANAKPTPGTAPSPLIDCSTDSFITNTGTIPSLVTRQTRPVVFAEFTNMPRHAVSVDYWIDDPETDGESSTRVEMNDQGMMGDQTAGDLIWSAALPALPINSIVRYKIVYGDEAQGLSSPHPSRDAFSWHAYFVDPQTDSNLPNNYHLFISSANWRTLHSATNPGRVTRGRANPRWNEEVPAVFVSKGIVHDVSVRHQGSRWNRKNGSTINFGCESHLSGSAQVRSWRIDFPSHRKHDGMDVIILQKQSGWPQHISFRMFELAGVPAPRTSWANLRINGCNYNSDAFQIERPGRDLVARWFDEVGDLFKSQGFTGDEGPWSWGDARLIRGSRNGSTEQERYEHTYNRKTLGWKNHPFDGKPDAPEAMIEGLHRARGRGREALRTWLAENFDVDQTLRYICTINYVGTFDDMFQNHYLYKKADDGKWCMFPWDLDNSLGSGGFSETNADPFRGVNEARHGRVGNRSGWWNRIKDSFFIAYESEFLEMFHRLNNTVHSPEAMATVIREGAMIRGISQGEIDARIRHVTRRHNYLNGFIEPSLAPPSLTLTQSSQGLSLDWPSHRSDYQLQQASDPAGPWIPMTSPSESPFEFTPSDTVRLFRLVPRP